MGKFYYNSVLLPEIPTVDGYPYVWIRTNNNSGNYDFLCSQTPWYKSGSNLAKTTTSTKWYTIGISSAATATEWSFQSDYSSEVWGEESGRTILWSSHDVPNGSLSSTDIYFRATEPISEKEIMGNQYSAIETDISSVTIKGKTGSFELGNEYTANKKTKVIACRIYAQSEQTVKARLWDASGNKLAESVETLCEKDSWTTLVLNNTVELEEGKNYVVSAGFSSYYLVDSSLLSFAKSVSFVQSRYIGTLGSYPSTVFNQNVYGLVDMIFEKYATKYLVRNNGTLYTVSNGALVEVSGTLNADLFMNSGADAIPEGALLMTLSAPEVLCWTAGEKVPTLTATVQGMPQGTHEIVSDNASVGHESVYGITSVEATASDGATFLLSFDGGMWMTYTNGSWSASDVGMSASEIVAIPTEAWQSMINSAQNMRLKAIIGGENTVTQVKFNFNNIPPV